MSPPSRLVCTSRVKRSSWCLGGSFLTSSGIFTRPTQFGNHWIWLHQYVKNELRVCSGRVIRVRCGLTRRKRRCRCRMHSEIRDVMQEADTHMHAHTYDENGMCSMAEGCVCVYICARVRRMTDMYRQCQGDLSAVDKTSSQDNLIPRIRVWLSIICDIRVTCSFGLTGQLDYRRQLNMENSP